MKNAAIPSAALFLLVAPCRAIIAPDTPLNGIPVPAPTPVATGAARAAARPLAAPAPDAAALSAFQSAATQPFTALKDPATGFVRQLAAGRTRAYAGPPKDAARAFLRDARPLLGPATDEASLGEPTATSQDWGSQVIFPQQVNGIAVLDHMVAVNLNHAGEVILVENATEMLPKVNTTPSISAMRAAGMARGKITAPPVLAIRAGGMEPRLVWQFTEAGDNLIPLRVTVDANSGRMIERVPLAHFATGQGLVYRGNPVSTPAREVLPLTSLDGSGNLTGSYTDIGLVRLVGGVLKPRKTATSAGLDFSFAPDTEELSQTQAYYGISHMHDWLKSTFNFTARDHVVPGFVRNHDYLNASFVSAAELAGYPTPNGYMIFGYAGSGGNPPRDYALDTDVLYHEYTHAVVGKVSPSLAGAYHEPEPGGINEAVADYFSSTVQNDPVLGEYAALATGDTYIRDLRSRNHYPEEVWAKGSVKSGSLTYPDVRLYPEVHQTGEVFGPALWDLRTVLGPQKADMVVFWGTSFMNASSLFQSALGALLTADDMLYGGADKPAIRDAFNRRGITEGAYPVKYQPYDAFFSESGESKILLGKPYTASDGTAGITPYTQFPSFNVEQTWQFVGYVLDPAIKTVAYVLKKANGTPLTALTMSVNSFNAKDTNGHDATFYYFWTLGSWAADSLPAGQNKLGGLQWYIHSYTEPQATVNANFSSLTPKAVAPSGAGYPAELQRAQTTPPIVAPGFGDTDGNGKVQIQDALLVTRALAGGANLTAEQRARADIAPPQDGNPNLTDARAILQRASGLL